MANVRRNSLAREDDQISRERTITAIGIVTRTTDIKLLKDGGVLYRVEVRRYWKELFDVVPCPEKHHLA